jgi:hypothetical protein
MTEPAAETYVSEYVFVPAPESELPLTPADIDTGADVAAADDGYAPTKWDTRDDLAAVQADYAINEEPVAFAAEAPVSASGFDFDVPEGDPLGELAAASTITPAEMDAIAALYTGLDDSRRAGQPAPDAEQEEEWG